MSEGQQSDVRQPDVREPRIVILGAGPTGLGAGYRLAELGYDDWVILEGSDRVGGLATSFTDDNGFTWDIGGHVMFSHYPYYDELVDRLMGDQYSTLNREAWVWMEDRFIPYPFQNNIGGLEPQTVLDCVMGAIEAAYQGSGEKPANFAEWIQATMGRGIGEHFMLPYNFKVWATPPEQMNYVWIGERVAVVDVEALLRNVLFEKPEKQWGPNSTFKYPLRGGTGFLYEGMRRYVEHKLELNTRAVHVDTTEKVVHTADGRRWPYDVLLSTVPVNDLVTTMLDRAPDSVRDAAAGWSGAAATSSASASTGGSTPRRTGSTSPRRTCRSTGSPTCPTTRPISPRGPTSSAC
jgi:protoporphyrinogen oxidase